MWPYLPIFGRIMLWNILPNGKKATFYYVKRWPKTFQQDLATVLALLSEGKIEARVTERMPLERAAEALDLLASGKASCKVVLVTEDGEQSAQPFQSSDSRTNRRSSPGRRSFCGRMGFKL